MKQHRFLTCFIGFLLISCLATCTLVVTGAGIFIWTGIRFFPEITDSTPQLGSPSAVEGDSQGKADPGIPPGEPAPGENQLSPEINAQMETIQEQVIAIRGLQPNGTFSRSLLTPEALRQDLLADFSEETSQTDTWQDVLILSSFGLLETDFDLYTFFVDLLTEQIAGYYDQETDEMVLIAGGNFGGAERLTYAHEYVHALQDQNIDIEALGFSDQACETDSERCAAVQALLEGDATFSQLEWFIDHATLKDRADIFVFTNETDMPVLAVAPAFIDQNLRFPYEHGLEFVRYLYDQGGWQAVNQAYTNPPVSTEQILHPDQYPEDKPVSVNLPDFSPILGTGWENIEEDVLGEWFTYLVLAFGQNEEARLDEKEAARATAGWGGDTYTVYYHAAEQATLMVLHTQWDTPAEAQEFAEAFHDYAKNRFGEHVSDDAGTTTWLGDQSYHLFQTEHQSTTWILAPDAMIAESVWQALKK